MNPAVEANSTAPGGRAARRYDGPGRRIGVWDPPEEIHPLSLHITGPDSAELWRHRFNPHNGSSMAARLSHSGGEMSEAVAWDEWHLEWTTRAWRDRLEGWIAAKITADWAEQGQT